jgi:hypothetical protein
LRSNGVFDFSQWLFCNYKVGLGAILYLVKKKKKGKHVEGTHAFQATRVTPFGIQKSPSTMLLKAPLSHFLIGVTHVSIGGLVWH